MAHCMVLQERKEKNKKVTNITDKCSVGPESEGMDSDLGLFLGTTVFAGPRRYWKKRLRFMEGAQQNNVVSDFPAELSFLFFLSFLWAISSFHKLKCYIGPPNALNF